MARNLDMTALRSFVTVADAGGVTKAAAQLNLTQSAVSMQLKRLEEMIGQPLLDRSARAIALSPQGDQLLGYARRMLALNDEAWGRLTNQAFEGEITLGVPRDIVYLSMIESGENPPKITEWTAPMRAQASIATGSSGIIGM